MFRMDGICFLSRNVFGELGVGSWEEVWGGKGLWFSPAGELAYASAGRY